MDLADAIEIVARTDRGSVRSHNEDSVLADTAIGLAVLADGMGGYNAGEVASGMTTALLGSELTKALGEHGTNEDGGAWVQDVIREEIARANSAIYQAAQSQPQYAGMGTTLVMAVFHDDMATVAHIGDSRLYRLRGQEFGPVTRDHSLLQEQIDSGLITPEQARSSQNRNLVTRALGVDPEVEPEIRDYEVLPGDIYLFCSDGLNDMVEDEEIGETLQMLASNLDVCATQLIQMANDYGGRDNISVILVRIKKAFPARRGLGRWWGRLLAWFK